VAAVNQQQQASSTIIPPAVETIKLPEQQLQQPQPPPPQQLPNMTAPIVKPVKALNQYRYTVPVPVKIPYNEVLVRQQLRLDR